MTTKQTAEAIGVHEFTPYDWQTRSETYRHAFLALKKKIDNERLERLEKELEKRALGGESKQSDILLMFNLKALDPKYRDRVPTMPFEGTIKVELSVPRPPGDIEALEAQKQLPKGKSTPRRT
jgi:hypothetical protein